jgi:hypothetical protein
MRVIIIWSLRRLKNMEDQEQPALYDTMQGCEDGDIPRTASGLTLPRAGYPACPVDLQPPFKNRQALSYTGVADLS